MYIGFFLVVCVRLENGRDNTHALTHSKRKKNYKFKIRNTKSKKKRRKVLEKNFFSLFTFFKINQKRKRIFVSSFFVFLNICCISFFFLIKFFHLTQNYSRSFLRSISSTVSCEASFKSVACKRKKFRFVRIVRE